jgi:hypothetical protein
MFRPAVMAKGWTQCESDVIVTLSVDGEHSLLPIWHGLIIDIFRQRGKAGRSFAKV